VKYNEIFIYLFFYTFFINSPTGQTRRRIFFTLDGSNDADSLKDVPFVGFVDITPHFGGEIPQKPKKGKILKVSCYKCKKLNSLNMVLEAKSHV